MHPKQMKRLATNPAAYMRYLATGRPPAIRTPAGPLIELLREIAPRDRLAIAGLTVDPRLGYMGSRIFPTAEQALRWIAPAPQMLESESWPAESWRDKHFHQRLYLQDLLACASSYPRHLIDAYPRLRRPDSRAQLPSGAVDSGGRDDGPPPPRA